MTWLRAAWGVISSRPALAIAGAVVGALIALELAGRGGVEVTPYTAKLTKRAAVAPVVVETLPVAVLKPDAKTRAKIAADYRKPGILTPTIGVNHGAETGFAGQLFGNSEQFAAEILSEVRFDPLPNGGTALTTIDRATGLPETTILPEQGISLRNRWLLGGLYGESETHDPANPRDEYWRVRGAWTPACRRMACASLEGGAFGGWMPTTIYGGVEISIGSR